MSRAVSKILEKSPLKYCLTKAVSCLVREIIANSSTTAELRMKDLEQIFFDSGLITALVDYKSKNQFSDLCAKASSDWSIKFQRFDRSSERLDDFYYNILDENKDFQELFLVIRLVLILSYGNACAESRFSINADILIKNLQEDSLVAQRIVYDAIHAAGGVTAVSIDKNMLVDARAAHRRYVEALEKRRRAAAEHEKQAKAKKRIADEIMQLQVKKIKIEKEAAAESSRLDSEIGKLMKTQK